MSISDILAIRNLMPGDEPEINFFRPGDEATPKSYKFRDKADEAAALAQADLILDRLRQEYGDDQDAVTEEFHEIVQENERLRAAVNMAVYRQLCEEPRFKKHFAKQERAERARLKRAAKLV